jgi:hypothetical protein
LGGILQDGSAFLSPEGDSMPEKDDVCIFYVYTQDDGSLLLGGMNSNVYLASDSLETIHQSETYKVAIDAYQNELNPRERNLSSYDAGTQNS